MSQSPEPGNKPANGKSRGRRRFFRVTLPLILVGLMGLVILLPHFLPQESLRQIIEKRMSAQTKSRVELGRASFGWLSGLELSRLGIYGPNDKSAVHVGRIHIPFEPVRFLSTGRISFVRVEDVRVDVDEAGELPPISNLESDTDKPFPVQRIQVSGLRVCVTWADTYCNVVDAPWLELVTDPNKQMVDFHGQASMGYNSGKGAGGTQPSLTPAGRFTAQGQLEIVQQNDQQCYAGTVRINWQDVDLSSLRLEKNPRLDLSRLAGSSGGSLQFRIFPDFHFSWELDASFRDVNVQRVGAACPSRIDPLRLVTTGDYDPVTGKLDMRKFEINSSTVDFRSSVLAQFDDTGITLSETNVAGRFNTSTLPQIVPGFVKLLGPQADISGPCQFDLQWTGKSSVYKLAMSVNADAVRVSGSDIVTKPEGTPLKWTFGVHADQSNWPWMAVDRCDLVFAGLVVHGSGTLPRIRPTDDVDWWVDSVRRLGQLEVRVESGEIEQVGQFVEPLKEALSKANLSGPVSIRLGYAGQEDVGRTDLELELADSAVLNVGDVFAKPAGQKMSITLQNFWPWHSDQPEVWSHFLARCGDVEILSQERPAKFLWAFSKRDGGEVYLDVVGNLETEIRGLDRIAVLSPRMKRLGFADYVGGSTVVKIGSAAQFALKSKGWNTRQARLNVAMLNDQTRISIADVVDKPVQVPMVWEFDYRLNAGRRQHQAAGVLKWQNLVSRVEFARSARDESLSGSFEVLVGDLNQTIAALPGLSKRLSNRINAVGRLAASCRWSGTKAGDHITCKVDGTDAGLVVNGREVKLPGVPAKFEGGVNFPKSNSEGQTYNISKLESTFGRSFLRLKKGSVTLGSMHGGRWLEMLGVAPWWAWRSSPVQNLEIDLEGRIDAETTAMAVNPAVEDIGHRYDLKGWVDFGVQTRFRDGVLHARVSSRLDSLGGTYANVVSKGTGTPGALGLEVFAWADRTDPKAYYAQMRPLTFQVGPVKVSAEAGGRVTWSENANLTIDSGQLKLDVDSGNLSDLSDISAMASRIRAGGRVSAEVVLARENGENRLGPCVLRFDDVSAQLGGQPVMLDGTIEFSHDYSHTGGLFVSAGTSAFEVDWQSIIQKDGVVGTAQIDTKFADVDQVENMLRSAVSELGGSEKAADKRNPTTLSQVQSDDIRVEAFQPIRRFLEKSTFLVTLDAKSFRITDPRSGIRHHLNDLLVRLDVGKNGSNRAMGTVEFVSRLSGGQIEGDFRADLTEKNPTLTLDSTIDNVKMTEAMRPLVENFFPGLTVKDRVTIKEVNTQKMFTTSKVAPNHPVGSGKMVFVEGLLVGRAAPESIARIFPGLNFTQYKFTRMHNWFTKRADGVVHNNMIFMGSPWNIYIEGDSKPGGFVEYEIGVDLLARYESEYWSTVGQGRIPILNTTGRIVNGKMTDQKVKYVPEQTIYSILVKNNAIVGAYRLLTQQLNAKP